MARPFTIYMRLWCIVNLLRISIGLNAGTGLVGSTLDKGALFLPLIVLAAGVFPSRCSGAIPFAAMLVRALTNIYKGAFMSNSQMWATQMDAALMLALAMQWFTSARKKSGFVYSLTADDERGIIGSCAKTIRWQLAIFYFASGFWKVNSSFLNPDYSCASLFTVQPLEYLPDDLLFATDGFFGTIIPLMARTIALIGPAATLVIEAVVPALHMLEPTKYPISAMAGVAFTLLFHLVIGMTPPPSNVSTYGVTTCLRLFFVMPDALTKAAETGGWKLGALMAFAGAASLAVVQPLHDAAISTVQGEGIDYHLGWYSAMMILFFWGMALEIKDHVYAVVGVVEGPVYRKAIWIAMIYAFVLPMLGLQEKAGCLMFSQLRLHGGSNHYLLPTSLAQRAWVDGPPSSAFSGGVIRVEATNLHWVGNTFAEHMTDRTLKVVRGLAKVPAEYVWAAKATSMARSVPAPRFRKHTLSNLGLRRLLATARRQKDAFYLKYTRLEGAVGDEMWRTASHGVGTYVIRGDGKGKLTCGRVREVGSTGFMSDTLSPGASRWGGLETACTAREEALVLEEPEGAVEKLLTWFLVPQPNPIIPGYKEEMHCVTWG